MLTCKAVEQVCDFHLVVNLDQKTLVQMPYMKCHGHFVHISIMSYLTHFVFPRGHDAMGWVGKGRWKDRG